MHAVAEPMEYCPGVHAIGDSDELKHAKPGGHDVHDAAAPVA